MRKRQRILFPLEPDEHFLKFWAKYPLKVSKQDALKAWSEIRPDETLTDKMIDALEWQTRQPRWLKDNGASVPYPATWLRGRRWEDEPFNPPSEESRGREVSRLTPFEQARRAGLK